MNRNHVRFSCVVLLLIFFAPLLPQRQLLIQASTRSLLNVKLVTDEAEAVLSILKKVKSQREVTDADWQRVFSSEGYVRLKQREHSMSRSFDDSDFQKFVFSDKLASRYELLVQTLRSWRGVDVVRAARLSLAYLPRHTIIRAKIYPVIKPRDNSFVFDIKNDPAIFLYLDPNVTPAQFRNTLAHELHHIGYGSSCPTPATSAEIAKLPENIRNLVTFIGAFGEGFAMLAAASGPNIHPHANSKREDRMRWDRDVANFNDDLKKVEAFFLDLIANKLSPADLQKTGFSFFGVQGPWYTVGWKMAVLIETTYGRRKLIDVMCDQRTLLSTYNRAAIRHNRHSGAKLAIWSTTVLKAIKPKTTLRSHQ